jgi:hypothetical protein
MPLRPTSGRAHMAGDPVLGGTSIGVRERP